MDGSSEFDLAISMLRHVAHGNGVVLRIADAIETAHNGEVEKLHEKVRSQRKQLSEVQDALHRRNEGELKTRWLKEMDELNREIDDLKMQYVIANRRGIALKHENAELRAKLDEQADTMHDGWVELPTDADGVPIHVGDVMASDSGTKGTVTSIAPNSIVLDHSSIGSNPKSFRHYHAPTVEDVTCEFLQDLSDWLGLSLDIDYIKADSLFAEYAQKLQLAKGGDE